MNLAGVFIVAIGLVAFTVVAAGCKPGGEGGGTSSEFQVDPSFVSDGDAERAAPLYAQHCVACHGVSGDGAGPAAGALSPRPANFAAAAVPAHRAYESIRGGGVVVGKAATMPPFEAVLSPDEIHDLVAYVRAFAH